MEFQSLRRPIRDRVKALILMGEAQEKLEGILGGLVPTHRVANMAAALDKACFNAIPGDVVLLSPACASFDQYANYQFRGEDFRRIVKRMQS
jgi:UDP-N-acetylmuramoylalanine--D-glutamate ligase